MVSAVAALRHEVAGNLVIMGSGRLIHSLLPEGLIDELLLIVNPVSLGTGTRLFPDDGALRRFSLVHAEGTESGLLLARYRAAGGDSPATTG